jgi:hypothetical protein
VQSIIDTKSFNLQADLIRQKIITKHNMFEAIQKTNEILKDMAKDIVASAIISSNLELLTDHPLDKRITTTVNGPISSGKGLFKSSLMQLDSIKINGDSYKTILNSEYFNRKSPIELTFFSQLVQEEIHYLCRQINTRLLEKINSQNQAPNVYLDKSIINQQAIDIATINGGEIKAILISLPISEAIKRSESRGKEIGRFEDTHEILTAHNSIAIKLTDLLIKNARKNITYSLYDNNIDVIRSPLKISEINLKSKKITIYNEVKFFELLNKSNLDIEESIKQQEIIYAHKNNITGCDLLNEISLSGYDIEPALSIC